MLILRTPPASHDPFNQLINPKNLVWPSQQQRQQRSLPPTNQRPGPPTARAPETARRPTPPPGSHTGGGAYRLAPYADAAKSPSSIRSATSALRIRLATCFSTVLGEMWSLLAMALLVNRSTSS